MNNLNIFLKLFWENIKKTPGHVPLKTPIALRLLAFLGDKFKDLSVFSTFLQIYNSIQNGLN